jgi:hypothetical protein
MTFIDKELGLELSQKKCHLLLTAIARTNGSIKNCFTPASLRRLPTLSYCTMFYHLRWSTQEQCDRFIQLTGFNLKDIGSVYTNFEVAE